MKKISDEVYRRINNQVYDSDELNWWGKDSSFNLIESMLNPVRVNYFKKILKHLEIDPSCKSALEVGCGGGLLSEEIYKMGFRTTGIDPSENALKIAKEHSDERGLVIEYIKGRGEEIPLRDESFDVVFCCDVLEHVNDLPKVISEVSRVLVPGGIFLYDTINRTLASKLVVIKIMQEWKKWAILPANLHVWKMFIRPGEMKELLMNNNLNWKEHRGIKTNLQAFKALRVLHQRVSNKISNEEFSKKMRLVEGGFQQVSYMGYALKMC